MTETIKTQTLMQVFEKLAEKNNTLESVAKMTEKLNRKLNRTEDRPSQIENDCGIEKEDPRQKNIVELFNDLADKIDRQIGIIGDNTDRSMQMID